MSCGSLPLIPICSWISEADPAVGLSGRARKTGAAALRLHRQLVWIRWRLGNEVAGNLCGCADKRAVTGAGVLGWRSNKKYRPSLIGNLIG